MNVVQLRAGSRLHTSASVHYHAADRIICLLGEAFPSTQFTSEETATLRHMKVLFCRLEQITGYEIDQSGKEFNSVDCIKRNITDFEMEYMVHLNFIF
jgi:hypothetical protein